MVTHDKNQPFVLVKNHILDLGSLQARNFCKAANLSLTTSGIPFIITPSHLTVKKTPMLFHNTHTY